MRVEGTLEVVPFESVVASFWGPPHTTTYHQLTQIILTFSLKMRLIIILHFPFSSRNYLCKSTPYHSQLNLPTCLKTHTISYNHFSFSTTHRLAQISNLSLSQLYYHKQSYIYRIVFQELFQESIVISFLLCFDRLIIYENAIYILL